MIQLDPEQLATLADLVADRIAERGAVASALVGVKELAAYLRVDESWVYANAATLGARRLGSGPKARLRFSLAEADQRLSACCRSRKSKAVNRAPQAASHKRRRRASGTSAHLLPIRGRISPESERKTA